MHWSVTDLDAVDLNTYEVLREEVIKEMKRGSH